MTPNFLTSSQNYAKHQNEKEFKHNVKHKIQRVSSINENHCVVCIDLKLKMFDWCFPCDECFKKI